MPLQLLVRWFFGLISLALLLAGGALLYEWWRHELDREWWEITGGIALLAVSFLGRPLVLAFIGQGGRRPMAAEGRVEHLTAPDGTRLAVETLEGPGPTLVMTHGWGLDRTSWRYLQARLAGKHRMIAWDLPGLGKTSEPPDKRYDLERFADALAMVAERAGGPVVLVGHSIGGMTIQTLLRRGPFAPATAAVLMNTTYARADKTVVLAPLAMLLRPLIIGLCYVQIGLWPLVWLQKWQSYFSGSLHLANRLTAFGPDANRSEIEHASRLAARAKPSVEAKGVLAALRWDATDSLGRLGVPVLTITGKKDLVTRPRAGQRIASAAGGVNAHDERAAHNSLMDRPERYAEAIETFLAGAPAAQPSPLRAAARA
jgi:pimeloyl-ACP methyl ester carboxylesterase